jgi:predicted cupin superfamily sugar epimerase
MARLLFVACEVVDAGRHIKSRARPCVHRRNPESAWARIGCGRGARRGPGRDTEDIRSRCGTGGAARRPAAHAAGSRAIHAVEHAGRPAPEVSLDAEIIRRLLGLDPLPNEGGFFVETYRAALRVPADMGLAPPAGRALATAIYYLITIDGFSAMHRVRSDELFHFYMGDAVEMLQLAPAGDGRVVTIGTNLTAGERPQVIVPAGVWQGARLRAGGAWALLGTTVSPGFEFEDYEHGDRAALIARFPAWRERIEALTRG